MKSDNSTKNIGEILRKLKKNNLNTESQKKINLTESRTTSLGMRLLLCEDGRFLINLTDLKAFSGITVFAEILSNEIIEECSKSNADVYINRSVDKRTTPELYELNVFSISVHIRSKIAKIISGAPLIFQKQTLSVFDAIQRPKWAKTIFPKLSENTEETETGSAALLFQFNLNPKKEIERNYFFLEFDSSSKFLRITIENSEDSRLYLKRIPHRVANIENQNCLKNADRISERVFQGIRRECQNQQDEYTEKPETQPELFEMLINSGLKRISLIKFRWNLANMAIMMIDKSPEIAELLTKIFMTLEDAEILEILSSGGIIEILNGKHNVYFDISRNGSCLNISMDKLRKKPNISEYLDLMPALKKCVFSIQGDFKKFRIVLVHHITKEILGLIKAFDILKFANLSTLFIKYKGIAPDELIESILALDESAYQFYSLQKVETSESVEGNYVLSNQYSPVNKLAGLDAQLRNSGLNFAGAMRLAAGNIFFREAFEAKRLKQKIILIEDGGYLASAINRFCLENKSVEYALTNFGIKERFEGIEYFPDKTELSQDLKTWLSRIFFGSVEHTKNGFLSVKEVETEFDGLAFPACSIAMSNVKNSEEARECAVSIINAIESIFNGRGKVISNRNIMIIGSRGYIGKNLTLQLSHKINKGTLCGVDITVEKKNQTFFENKYGNKFIEYDSIENIPEEIFLNTDLIIGITGISVLKQNEIEKLILSGKKKELFFASGSTKTAEFEDLSNYLQSLKESDNPKICGTPIKLEISHLKDPQTGMIQGNKIRIYFDKNENNDYGIELPEYRDLYLLGDLMPINFLYYGVPTEIIDLILEQLLRVTAGLINSINNNNPLPNRLMGVDYEIDENANLR
ncbi:MAG TPA: hypothetical protein PKY81_15215 [bacterium]|nr:hypothetical protein [bacterium]